jgi:cytochrome c
MRRRDSIALVVVTMLISMALSVLSCRAQTLTAPQQRGEVIARGMCSGCHAVGKIGVSPRPDAPRFRTLNRQTNLDKLAQRLREGLMTGHEGMPTIRFDRDDADAMVAYLRTLQSP